MIKSLLIANRGEIASRIIRTCKRLGIRSIVPYTTPDRSALFVTEADEAVFVDARPPSRAYLEIERLIEIAKATSAEAIHPGYGFLSESAELSSKVRDAGVIFIGPPPDVLIALGSKDRARILAVAEGVPVAPGYDGPEQGLEQLIGIAQTIGFPLLIKAAAGGGGRGMKRIDSAAQLADGLRSARREAETFFGNGRLILERLVAPARHVEVQIAGDTHGNVVHLFERDCSLQRNYQKVIEESPARGLPDQILAALYRDAVALGRAVGTHGGKLTGLATVEFLVPVGSGHDLPSHIFLEINPRLQVEHPVTEMRLGIDLVELQLHIASGLPIPFRQEQLVPKGSSVEARVCAEIPREGFQPSAGTISGLMLPETAGAPLRLEHSLAPGLEIGSGFDSLILKAIAHGGTYDEALATLIPTLEAIGIGGLDTNQAFLIELLEKTRLFPPDTVWIAQYLAGAAGAASAIPLQDCAAFAAAALLRSLRGGAIEASDLSRAASLTFFRSRLTANESSAVGSSRYLSVHAAGAQDSAGLPIAVFGVRNGRFDGSFTVRCGDTSSLIEPGPCTSREIALNADGVGYRFFVERERLSAEASTLMLHFRGTRYSVELSRVRRAPGGSALDRSPAAGPAGVKSQKLAAPLPGVVLSVLVERGMTVSQGTPLVIIESMKMEHTIFAPWEGHVTDVFVSPQTAVKSHQPLLELASGSVDR